MFIPKIIKVFHVFSHIQLVRQHVRQHEFLLLPIVLRAESDNCKSELLMNCYMYYMSGRPGRLRSSNIKPELNVVLYVIWPLLNSLYCFHTHIYAHKRATRPSNFMRSKAMLVDSSLLVPDGTNELMTTTR